MSTFTARWTTVFTDRSMGHLPFLRWGGVPHASVFLLYVNEMGYYPTSGGRGNCVGSQRRPAEGLGGVAVSFARADAVRGRGLQGIVGPVVLGITAAEVL